MLRGCTIYISNVTTSQPVIYKINTESEHEGLHLANWHAALQTHIYNITNVVQFSIFLGDRILKNGAVTHACTQVLFIPNKNYIFKYPMTQPYSVNSNNGHKTD